MRALQARRGSTQAVSASLQPVSPPEERLHRLVLTAWKRRDKSFEPMTNGPKESEIRDAGAEAARLNMRNEQPRLLFLHPFNHVFVFNWRKVVVFVCTLGMSF